MEDTEVGIYPPISGISTIHSFLYMGVRLLLLLMSPSFISAPSQKLVNLRTRCEERTSTLRAKLESCCHGPASRTAEGDDGRLLKLMQQRLEASNAALQVASRQLLRAEFGGGVAVLSGRRLVELKLQLPGQRKLRTVMLQMAPDDRMPVAVLYFLRQVAAGNWDGARFIRNAQHVLQASPVGNRQKFKDAAAARSDGALSIPFQEYSPEFPHVPFSVGLAGRPGGPDFYISLIDNSINHGPGTQHPDAKLLGEADTCFATVINGFEALREIQRLPHRPGAFHELEQHVNITVARIL